MTNEQYEALAAEHRAEVKKLFPRVMLFSLILLMSHVVEIRPSNFSAAGVQLIVKDVVVVRGGIALVFYFYFWSIVRESLGTTLIFPRLTHKRIARNLIAFQHLAWRDPLFGKPVRPSPSKVKRSVRAGLIFHDLMIAPFVVVCLLIVIAAFAMGWPDVWNFGVFVVDHLSEPPMSVDELANELARRGASIR